jgi:hypothetical protein
VLLLSSGAAGPQREMRITHLRGPPHPAVSPCRMRFIRSGPGKRSCTTVQELNLSMEYYDEAVYCNTD